MNWLRFWALFIYHLNIFFDPHFKNNYYLENKKQWEKTCKDFKITGHKTEEEKNRRFTLRRIYG